MKRKKENITEIKEKKRILNTDYVNQKRKLN